VAQKLTEEGHTVRSAENGQEAWQKIEQAPPAVLLLGMLMSIMGGTELAVRLYLWALYFVLIFQ
jgi:CheY-like chemotaxis protein